MRMFFEDCVMVEIMCYWIELFVVMFDVEFCEV